ncbi:MAG: hypothetical protein AAGF11_24975 [Myxococcota bacterium]
MTHPKISLTDFVDITSASGTPKHTKVKQAKNRPAYDPRFDFYKKLREGIVDAHNQHLGKKHLDTVMAGVTDTKKLTNYPNLVAGHKKWWGRKKLAWFDPPSKTYSAPGGLVEVRINPELGLEINGKPHLIKLYFKSNTVAKNKVDIITHLMKLALGAHAPANTTMALLDIRNSKLICPTVPISGLTAMVQAELAYVDSLWPNV